MLATRRKAPGGAARAQKWEFSPPETVIAEKFHARVMLGLSNSRLKDFYDIWYLTQVYPFRGAILAEAIDAAFRARKTKIPKSGVTALTPQFAQDPAKRVQWNAFIGQTGIAAKAPELGKVIEALELFLSPIISSMNQNLPAPSKWEARVGWRKSD